MLILEIRWVSAEFYPVGRCLSNQSQEARTAMLKELLLVTATALALNACSTTPQPATREAPATTATAPNCVRDSGSRIPDSACRHPGSAYSSEELRDTGQTDAAGALRQLDPRITGH